MKKLLFALCTLTLFITSCSQEELDGLNNNARDAKIATYKERAQRLAEKYGIDMQLNEEHIDDIIKNLSFEQMEKDFAMIANMEIVDPKPTKLGIKRRVTLNETKPHNETFYKEIYASFNGGKNPSGQGTVTIDWHYIPYGGSFADIVFTFTNNLVTFSTTISSPHIYHAQPCSFETDADHVYMFLANYYYVYYAHCHIEYNKYSNIKRISITR